VVKAIKKVAQLRQRSAGQHVMCNGIQKHEENKGVKTNFPTKKEWNK
jgi:hypothetical protein